ncbi:MAG: aminopeptidase N [Desulfuromonas sp.]|nr:MAG: aminopeptidase N [Desulfuromonas sp.]
MNHKDKRAAIRRSDYRAYPYTVETVQLHVDLHPTETRVDCRMQIRRNLGTSEEEPLVLVGQGMTLNRVQLDDVELPDEKYLLDSERLILDRLPEQFVLETQVTIDPQSNEALEGLYMSNGMFCTQCEAEGFRKITFYPDRPDVLARFTTTVVGSVEQQPVLLANGNPVARGELDGGRHFVTWEDPYPKPSYLFALVAGDLHRIEDSFTTVSGRKVALQFYVEPRNKDKCAHAIASLKQAMRWDEQRFGLEYDLDIYMVVAVDDFNMGAMENKGLNVFNSKYVLAKPETATDSDFEAIQGVIGHEYFHNWTGNRVTCRDWFQLSLKEGLTVYRDQEFSADMTSRPVKRIEEVRMLRAAQFPEDSGPLAHPVRPENYVEINNFYTTTIYNKGAEVVRMIATLLGDDGFRAGMDLYIQRHDGQAATVDDFVSAMADANGTDLTQFMRWYSQAGTPVIKGVGSYDPKAQTYTLSLTQHCPPTPGQEQKQPFHVPVVAGLIGKDGSDLATSVTGAAGAAKKTNHVLELRDAEQSFVFEGVTEEPIPSLLREFSAPVKLSVDYTRGERAFLMAHDSDSFNRWEAAQQLACELLLEAVTEGKSGPVFDAEFIEACRVLVCDDQSDAALRALALTLPGEGYLSESMAVVDPVAVRRVRQLGRKQLGVALQEEWREVYARYQQGAPYACTPEAIGARSLRNQAMAYLVTLDEQEHVRRCLEHYRQADNMTDAMAAVTVLVNQGCAERQEVLDDFAARWQADPLVMDKWFSVQAVALHDEVLQDVQRLMAHPAFSIKNPNKVRSLIGAFAHGNPGAFHRSDGEGYRFVGEQVVLIDQFNPQVAARLASVFTRWGRYDAPRQEKMRSELERMLAAPRLSEDVYEIASKSLKG